MRTCLSVVLTLVWSAAAPAQETKAAPTPPPARPPTRLSVGNTVPAEVQLRDLHGATIRFADLRGKVLFVHWWSATCRTCRRVEPKLAQIAKDYAERGVIVIGIVSNRVELGPEPVAADFMKEKSEERPYLKLRQKAGELPANRFVLADHSGAVARLFRAHTTPHCFVIDAAGKLVYSGALDNNEKHELGDAATPHVRTALDQVLAGAEVREPATFPYGSQVRPLLPPGLTELDRQREGLEESRFAKARHDLAVVRNAALMYRIRYHKVPTMADLTKPDDKGDVPLPDLGKDPWGNDYVIRGLDRRVEVFSCGPDGLAGTADDLVSRS